MLRLVEERPTAAFVLSLIGGVFITLNGVLWIAVPSFLEELSMACGFTAFLLGLLVILGAGMLYSHPNQRVAWGVIIAVFSLVSIGTGGGLFMGMILGLIGGILGAVWKPRAPQVPQQDPRWYPQSYGPQGNYPASQAYNATAAQLHSSPRSQPGLSDYEPQDENSRRLYSKLTSKSMQDKVCTRCGALNLPVARFCNACGSRL